MYFQGIGDSSQGFANFVLFCLFTDKIREKFRGSDQHPAVCRRSLETSNSLLKSTNYGALDWWNTCPNSQPPFNSFKMWSWQKRQIEVSTLRRCMNRVKGIFGTKWTVHDSYSWYIGRHYLHIRYSCKNTMSKVSIFCTAQACIFIFSICRKDMCTKTQLTVSIG